jgi:acyl-CoA synthetase (AMP-forming)/AMP-acid ligase II
METAPMIEHLRPPACAPLAGTMADLLRLRAQEHPGRPALTFLADGEKEDVRLTYGELDARARAIAAKLQGLAGKGDRALLLYPPGVEFVAAFFGCLYAGVAAVPLFPPRPNRPLPRLLSVAGDARSHLALTTSEVLLDLERRLRQAPELADLRWLATDTVSGFPAPWREPDLAPDGVAYLQYTSGSTSSPKGVMVTHANLLENERMLLHAWGNHEGATIVSWLPLYHDMGLIGVVLQSVYTAAHCVLMPPVSFLQQPLRWLKAVSRYRARFSGGPNFAYDLSARKITAAQKAELDLSGWEVAFSGSEPIRAETLRRFAEAFEPCGFRWEALCPGYGLAEATLAVSSCRWTDAPTVREMRSRQVVGCGGELPGSRIAIVDPEARTRCRPGQEGEVWVAGPHVAAGYWGREAETLATFGARLAETGEGPFLRTGDLGFLLGGELHVSGRIKDLVILDGRNLHPQDVEETAERSHLALRTAGGAAFSVDDGEQERLVVVHEVERHARTRDELAEIAAAVRQAVAEEHDARVWRVCLIRPGALPKTSSGKVQRQACKAAFVAGALETVDGEARP